VRGIGGGGVGGRVQVTEVPGDGVVVLLGQDLRGRQQRAYDNNPDDGEREREREREREL
jgi:hypothetical protein